MAASLNHSYKLCRDGFTRLLQSLQAQENDDLRARVADQNERFNIWAGNIGARQHSQAKTSLDWRVREAHRLKHQIEELLEDLTEAVDQLTSITSGARPNRTSSPVSSEDGSQIGLSELDELVEMLSESIAGLFKITLLIQRATPRDRFSKAQSIAKESFNPAWDILHVGDKFPKLTSESNAWLQRKFGQANSQRRQFFNYTRQHKEKKAAIVEEAKPSLPETSFLDPVSPVKRETEPQETQTILSSQKPASSFAQTTASTLAVATLHSKEQENEEDDAMSYTSFATSVNESGNMDRIRVPRLQDVAQGQQEFECPYCFTIVRPRSHNQWKKHVFEDLRPYVCTFKGCDVKLFVDRRTWFEHEIQHHRLMHKCPFCSRRPYSSQKELQAHLVARHKEYCPPNAIATLLQASQEPQETFDASSCPCCTDWEEELRRVNAYIPANESVSVTGKQFRNHLASHQEQIALFALPKYYEDDKEDTESAGVAVGDSSNGLSRISEFSNASSTSVRESKTGKLFEKLVKLLEDQNSPDFYELHAVVNELVLGHEQADEVFKIILLSKTPLREELIEFAIDNGANLGCFINGKTPLTIACEHQSLPLAQLLLDRGANIDARSGSEVTALHTATQMNWFDGAKILIAHGANVNGPSDTHENRALHIASRKEDSKFASFLLSEGAMADQVNSVGKTALHIAVEYGSLAVVDLLLAHHANINLKDIDGRTALHYAVCEGRINIVDFLLTYNADPNSKDRWHDCPLISATSPAVEASGNCDAIVRSLLDCGASIQLWRTRITRKSLASKIDRLLALQKIIDTIDGPVTIEMQPYIDEAREFGPQADTAEDDPSITGQLYTYKDIANYVSPDPLPDPATRYWLEAEASQQGHLKQRHIKYGSSLDFTQSLETLGQLYCDWISALNRASEDAQPSGATELRARLSLKLTATVIDLWFHKSRTQAQWFMIRVIQANFRPVKDPNALLQYSVITAIASAMAIDCFRSSPWRRNLRPFDWESAIEYRDSNCQVPLRALTFSCPNCSFDHYNETIYKLHLTWHDAEKNDPGFLASSIPQQSKVDVEKVGEKECFYSGPVIYGVMKHSFKGERFEDLEVKKSQTVMLLALADQEWFIARTIDKRYKSGMVPISAVEIYEMSSRRAVTNPRESIEAANLPRVEQWRDLDSLLQLRSNARRAMDDSKFTRIRPTAEKLSIVLVEISRNLDFYYIDCQILDGQYWRLGRFYMEFYELQALLASQFPGEAKPDKRNHTVLPYLPGPAVSEGRREILETYLSELLSLPARISSCNTVAQFFIPILGDSLIESSDEIEEIKDDVVEHESGVTRHQSPSPHDTSLASGPLKDAQDIRERDAVGNSRAVDETAVEVTSLMSNKFPRWTSRSGLSEIIAADLLHLYDVPLDSRTGKAFADWLIHLSALDLATVEGDAIQTLLRQITTKPSDTKNLGTRILNAIFEHIDMHQLQESSSSCSKCARADQKLFVDGVSYFSSRIDSTTKLCVPCSISLSLLPVHHTSDHFKFSEWIITTLLRLGNDIVGMAFDNNNIPVDENSSVIVQHRRRTIEFSCDLLEVTESSWPSADGRQTVDLWIWAEISDNPKSFVLSDKALNRMQMERPNFREHLEFLIQQRESSDFETKAENSKVVRKSAVDVNAIIGNDSIGRFARLSSRREARRLAEEQAVVDARVEGLLTEERARQIPRDEARRTDAHQQRLREIDAEIADLETQLETERRLRQPRQTRIQPSYDSDDISRAAPVSSAAARVGIAAQPMAGTSADNTGQTSRWSLASRVSGFLGKTFGSAKSGPSSSDIDQRRREDDNDKLVLEESEGRWSRI